jgi:hypothetical protein
MGILRLSEQRSRIYGLLREGKSQAKIAQITGIGKTTVLKAARWFVKEGFLTTITKEKPYTYDEGPRVKELDNLIASRRATPPAEDGVHHHATSVREVSPAHSKVNTSLAHHIKVRYRVEKIGDMGLLKVKDNGTSCEIPFLDERPYFDYHGVRRTKGALMFQGGVCSVEFEEGPSATWFYIHLPELELTPEQLNEWEQIYSKKAQEASNFIQKWGGWKFGLMEFCTRWKPHFSTEDRRILERIVGKLSASSASGNVWFSDSEGRRELEASKPELAQIIVALPEEVYELKLRMGSLLEILKMMEEADRALAHLEASRLEHETVEYGLKNRRT